MNARASADKVSVYVSRLRRAFLLQVHPDRFRSQTAKVREEQASLIQALSDRMGEQDFVAYTASSRQFHLGRGPSAYGTYLFSVQKKDGTISKLSIQLDNSTPHQILQRMASSIDFPPPPPPPTSSPTAEHLMSLPQHVGEHFDHSLTSQNSSVRNNVDQLIWSYGSYGSYHRQVHQNSHAASKDRNILHFLKHMDFDHIKQRKLDRLNASAAALVARRAFQFSAIDGTGLGWSSASLASCLSRLTALHDEHKSKLHKSFYPFRLVFSSDELHRRVDLFGGIIRLNPAATSLQWLGTLIMVDDESIRMLKKNQSGLERNLSKIENLLGLRAVKGHTCEPEEYHRCVKRLARECDQSNIPGEGKSLLYVSNKARLVIESGQICRRGKLRKDGSFEVAASMDVQGIRKVLANFASKSNECIQTESENQVICQRIVSRVMYEFGVQRVNKVSSTVACDQMSSCLNMLLKKNEIERRTLRGYLAGHSIGVAGHGHFCHLGDDGSIVIPSNCS